MKIYVVSFGLLIFSLAFAAQKIPEFLYELFDYSSEGVANLENNVLINIKPIELTKENDNFEISHIRNLLKQKPQDNLTIAYKKKIGNFCSLYSFQSGDEKRDASDASKKDVRILPFLTIRPDMKFIPKQVSWYRIQNSKVKGPLYVQNYDLQRDGKIVGNAYLVCDHKKRIKELKAEIIEMGLNGKVSLLDPHPTTDSLPIKTHQRGTIR